MDNLSLYTDYQLVPKDYVCPICGHNFWDLNCPHSEWDIIQHFEKVVRMYANHDNWISVMPNGGNYVWYPPENGMNGYTIAEEALK